MIILKDQTLYKCEYCGKRLLTRGGAQMHEQSYCKNPESPHMIEDAARVARNQANCGHYNKETIWRCIPGEAVKMPYYDVCTGCGLRM